MTRKTAEPTEEGPAKPARVGTEDPPYYEALGRAIKVARTQFGLDRKDLATLANVSYAYLADIETGRGRPGSRSLFAIAAALGRTPAELMHEAEVYRTQITGEPLIAALDPALSRSATPSEGAAGTSPSRRALVDAWRERLETSESAARAELHDIVDRLSREDLGMALTLARRLFGGAGRTR
jgi:transcriptional regulator with XRE-family HTH domain